LSSLLPSEPWKRNQYAVLVSVFTSFMGFSFVQPFMPLYIRQLGVTDVGEAALYSGIAFGVAPLFSGILAPFWGMLADRHGVKIMVQRAMLSFVIINFLMGLVVVPWQLLGLRMAIGLFGGFGPMTASLVTIGAPQDQVGPAIGRLQATQILAGAVGPFVGGILADTLGIRTTFMFTAAQCLVAFGLMTVLYREDRAEQAQRRARPRLPMRALLVLPGFLPLVAILFFAQAVDRGAGPILPLYVAELDPTVPVASTSGLIVSAGALVSAVAASQVGRLISRRGARVLLPISLLIGFLATAPVFLVTAIWQLVALRVLFGIASGTTATLAYAAASDVVPEESRATAFGFLGSGTSLATALGPFGGGAIATISLRAAFGAYALIYGVALALGLLVVARQPRR
jgi:DHA1 family multidrug resistance protein-like MFS transporter